MELAPFRTPSVGEIEAVMAASFLCGVGGIAKRTVDNSAAYIGARLKRLRDDRKLIVHAAAHGEKHPDRFADIIYVLHSFQKKSRHGIATDRRDIDLIKERLARAEELHRQRIV